VVHRRHTAAVSRASLTLADYLGEIHEADSAIAEVGQFALKDEDALSLAMERVYRDGMRRRQFKVCLTFKEVPAVVPNLVFLGFDACSRSRPYR
jgi:hypothetical protein